MKFSPLSKVVFVACTCAVLASLSACGGGSSSASGGGGGGGGDAVTTSTINLPSSVQVVTPSN